MAAGDSNDLTLYTCMPGTFRLNGIRIYQGKPPLDAVRDKGPRERI